MLLRSTEKRRQGQRETSHEPPAETQHCVNKNLWTTLSFAQATWRSTSRVRAITSANDIDLWVQEVLDLPVLNLATAQGEDPDLLFLKELLQDHDSRPQWDTACEESAEVNILWTQFHGLKTQENVLYYQRKKSKTTCNGKWCPPSLSDPKFLALLDYVSRSHEIETCPSSIRPSMLQLSLTLMHRFLSNFGCCFPWGIR